MDSGRPPREADLDLATAALRGDKAARRRFAERMECVPPFLAALNRRLGGVLSADDLADLSQDTLIVIWQKLALFEGRATLETWAHRFCHLELMNRVRRLSRQSPASNDGIDAVCEPVTETMAASRYDELERGLQSLTPEEEQVMRLRHFDNLMFTEVAERLGITRSIAKHRYYRALTRLRHRLRGDGGRA